MTGSVVISVLHVSGYCGGGAVHMTRCLIVGPFCHVAARACVPVCMCVCALQEHYVVVLGVVGDEEGWLTEGLRLKQLSSLGGNCS